MGELRAHNLKRPMTQSDSACGCRTAKIVNLPMTQSD